MDWIAVADLALLIVCTLVFIARSPVLPFGNARGAECAAPCAAAGKVLLVEP